MADYNEKSDLSARSEQSLADTLSICQANAIFYVAMRKLNTRKILSDEALVSSQ